LTGRADLVRGDYEFAGRNFRLERGIIRFRGESPPDPLLDIRAEANVQGLDATVNVQGTGLTPEITFTSVPQLPQDELLSRILFGTSITNLSAPEALQLASAVAALRTGGGGLDPLNSIRRAVGLDRLRILPADIATETTDPTGTTVTYTLPTATDNEDPNPAVTCTPAAGTKFTVGSTVVTCTAKDANGNTSTKSFNVIVGLDSTVGGNVPATLALTMGAPAQFGAFTPGIAKDYTASTTATVISTAGDATLSVADPSTTAPGRLVNGTFALATPLQGLGMIKTWSAPTSNESVPVTFKQSIAANEPLRTGTYSKTLTFTLSTTTP